MKISVEEGGRVARRGEMREEESKKRQEERENKLTGDGREGHYRKETCLPTKLIL